jgi:hypothetical protein
MKKVLVPLALVFVFLLAACQSGSRGPAAVAHSVASSDPFYEDIAATSVSINGAFVINLFLPVVGH